MAVYTVRFTQDFNGYSANESAAFASDRAAEFRFMRDSRLPNYGK